MIAAHRTWQALCEQPVPLWGRVDSNHARVTACPTHRDPVNQRQLHIDKFARPEGRDSTPGPVLEAWT